MTRGALALLSTQPLTWSATLLTTIFVPRYLGAEGYGQYAMAMTIAGLAGVVAALGVPGYLTRQIAREPSRAAVLASGTLALLTIVAVVVAVVTTAGPAILGSPISEPRTVQIALGGMVVLVAQQALYAYFIGHERHAHYAWLNAAWVAVSAVAGVGVLFAGGGLLAYLTTTVIATAATTALLWHISKVKLSRQSFDLRLWGELVRGGLAFLGFNLAMRVRNQIDVLVIGLLLTEQSAGLLAAAYRIVSIPVFIPTLIVTPLIPALSRSVDNNAAFKQTLQQSLTVAFFLTVGASGAIVGMAPVVPTLLGWGEPFERAVPLMMILALGEPLGAIDSVLAAALLAMGRERNLLRITIAASIFNPTLNLLAIPAFESWFHAGAVGAAAVEVTTELLMFAGALYLLPRGLLGWGTVWTGARILLAGTALAVTSRLVLVTVAFPFDVPCAALAGGTAFLGAAILLGVVTPRDLWARRSDILSMLPARMSVRRGASA
ncbi:MAG: oligosaccharide flippase family protein [Chloroflexi bacterium]|nr:oligosaccharide flippase family protein [Chloroflexota bacterium]